MAIAAHCMRKSYGYCFLTVPSAFAMFASLQDQNQPLDGECGDKGIARVVGVTKATTGDPVKQITFIYKKIITPALTPTLCVCLEPAPGCHVGLCRHDSSAKKGGTTLCDCCVLDLAPNRLI